MTEDYLRKGRYSAEESQFSVSEGGGGEDEVVERGDRLDEPGVREDGRCGSKVREVSGRGNGARERVK